MGAIDFLCHFLKNDNLGRLSIVHLAFCDKKGDDGPKHPDAIEMSAMLQKAVDFAKHGEGITSNEL